MAKTVRYHHIRHQTGIICRMLADQVGYFTDRDIDDLAQTVHREFWTDYLADRVPGAGATAAEQIAIVEQLLARLLQAFRDTLGVQPRDTQ